MKVFLSSTYRDLVAHRKAVTDALERLGQQAGRMEVFGARPDEPMQASLTEVDDCDVFVGVYAHRYGFIPAGSAVSITEAEFDCAARLKKPLFCFIVDDDHPWPPKMIEDGLGKARLHALKDRIQAGVVRETFTTPEDLAVKVATSLGRYLSQPPAKGGQSRRVLPSLCIGTWTLRHAIDLYDWSGSTLRFRTQEETPLGLALTGSFTWRTGGEIIGTEVFEGQYVHENRYVILEGTASAGRVGRPSADDALSDRGPRITSCSYSAILSEDERSLLDGRWGSTMTHDQTVPGKWEATR
jgi:hypothetical protein